MKTASDVMTPDPVCCALDALLSEVAKLMVQHNCGELPVVDADGQLVGVVTDRDIVCRVVAAGKNPLDHTVRDCVSQPVISVGPDAPLSEVMTTMERHQIRRVPVVDARERCIGIIALADLAWEGERKEVAVLVRKSRGGPIRLRVDHRGSDHLARPAQRPSPQLWMRLQADWDLQQAMVREGRKACDGVPQQFPLRHSGTIHVSTPLVKSLSCTSTLATRWRTHVTQSGSSRENFHVETDTPFTN